jgi:hypothetical protein
MGWLKAMIDGFADSFKIDDAIDDAPQTRPAPQADRASGRRQNDADAYGVRVEPVKVETGQWYWRAVEVHHLSPEENHGNHHIYLDVLDPALPDAANAQGGRVFGARLKVTWDGGESLVTVDKPLGEPGGNFPMWKSQDCTVAALGLPGHELPSDRVAGLHTRHPDEASGNTWGHHSFSVLFVRTQAGSVGGKPLAHYVLFGPAEQPATAVNLLQAQEYLLAFHPAFGFNPAEAAGASRVTIMADEQAVSTRIVADLTAAGATVERISGTAAEVAAILADQVARK